MEHQKPAPARRKVPAPSLLRRAWNAQVTPVAVATVALIVVAAVVTPSALQPASIIALTLPAAVMAIAGIGQTLVVQQKGIDLSTPGAITLAATLVTTLSSRHGWPFWSALVLALLVVALLGAVNGLIVTRFNITPIVATLASNSLFFGGVWTVSASSTAAPPAELVSIAKAQVGPFPMIGIIAILLVAVAAMFARYSALGRRFEGVGASPAAARAAGVVVEPYIIGSYVLSSVTAGLAGVLLVGFLGSNSLTLGNEYLLPIIAAVVVGGAALTGGKGSILATAVAAIFLALIVQMVLSVGAPNSTQLLVQSIALAAAAGLKHIPWGRVIPRRPSPLRVNA